MNPSPPLLSELHDHTENQRVVRQMSGFPLFVGLPHALDRMLGSWLKKKDATRSALLESDTVLLSVLQSRGHLKSLPLLADTDRRDNAPSSFRPRLGRPGLVTVCSRLDGSPVEFENVTTPTVSRWLVLLHEVGHHEFQTEPSPFRPSSAHGMGPGLVQQLNQWSLGPAGMLGKGRAILNECFADVYASMVMLSSLEGDVLKMAEAQIRANHANRWTKSERVDRLYVKDLEEVSDLGNPLSPHLTGPTLDRMWATRESWQGLPAQQLREKALELASDGWLDVMDVARKDAKTGFPVGWSYRWGALPTPLEKSVGEAVSELGTAYLNGTNLRHAMKDWRGANPAFEEAMASALPMLQESFEEHFPGTRRAFLEHRGLNVSLFDLGRWVVTFTAQLLEKNAGCPEQASAFEALRQAHQRAHANVFEGFVDQPARQSDWANSLVLVSIALKQQRQALGCEVALPASPVAWRQTRETSMPSPAVSVAQSPKM